MSCIRPLGLLLTLLGLSSRPAQGQQGFSLGVASGDVTATSAICWTRSDSAGLVQLQIATDRAFNHVVLTRSAEAAAENDYTVKIDIDGLSPATDYYYRFVNLDQPTRRSRIGHFRTAPDPAEPAPFRFIISGDSNLALAPWLLLHFAAQEQADFFIWFGDTIYADVAYPGSPVATDLPTYRDKYYDAHAEPYLQELLASLAVWCGWDDHEVADNYDGGQPEPWISPEQIQDAYRAFFEYMPIRPQNVPDDPFRTYRRFRYGALAEFFILDGRQYRQRDLQADCDGNLDPYGLIIAPRDQDCVDRLEAPDRSMLGPEQFQWLTTALAESSATYKFLINNVPLTSLVLQPYDHWDGYDAERRALLEFID
ncbi:MAG: alkaline phosphatase D family protein, partial [Phycisphaerae bacterium]